MTSNTGALPPRGELQAVTIATHTYQNLIGGRWVDAKSGATFDSVSPANHEELIGTFPASGVADVDAAVEAAKKAFPAWSLMPAPKRGEILFKVARILAEHKEELSRLMGDPKTTCDG